jgi:hypothetical protein
MGKEANVGTLGRASKDVFYGGGEPRIRYTRYELTTTKKYKQSNPFYQEIYSLAWPIGLRRFEDQPHPLCLACGW